MNMCWLANASWHDSALANIHAALWNVEHTLQSGISSPLPVTTIQVDLKHAACHSASVAQSTPALCQALCDGLPLTAEPIFKLLPSNAIR